MEITPDYLVAAAAVALSMLFSYVPGLRTWYAGMGDEIKRLIMLGLLVAVSALFFGLGCAGLFETNVACDAAGALVMVKYLLIAIVANQSAYLISPVTNDVRAVK